MTADFPFARIVAGRYRVRTLLLRPLRERAEFYVLVAQNVGIRGNALRVVPYHPLDDFPFVFLRKVYLTKWHTERGAYPHCVEPILTPRTFNKFRLPYFDESSDDVISLLFQERGRDRTIHAP